MMSVKEIDGHTFNHFASVIIC